MGPDTRRYDKFKGYTASDCDCKWCLHNGGKKRGCTASVCCCLEERISAGCDMATGADKCRHTSVEQAVSVNA